MDIKQSPDNESERSQEKGGIVHLEHIQDHKMSKAEQMHAVDEAIANPNVTLESFAHLDIKKILWKMDMRLVPMLTLLYLVSSHMRFTPAVYESFMLTMSLAIFPGQRQYRKRKDRVSWLLHCR